MFCILWLIIFNKVEERFCYPFKSKFWPIKPWFFEIWMISNYCIFSTFHLVMYFGLVRLSISRFVMPCHSLPPTTFPEKGSHIWDVFKLPVCPWISNPPASTSEFWNYSLQSLCLVYEKLEIEPRASACYKSLLLTEAFSFLFSIITANKN